MVVSTIAVTVCQTDAAGSNWSEVVRNGLRSPQTLEIQTDAFSVRGLGRKYNEDAFFVSHDSSVMVVADGTRPRGVGRVASQITVDVVSETLCRHRNHHAKTDEVKSLINAALVKANAEIIQQTKKHREYAAMGSTIVVAVRIDSVLIIKSVGDSRAYLFRNQSVRRLTTDHTLTQFLISTGQLGPRLESVRPQRKVLLNHLGRHDFTPNDEFGVLELGDDDRILLCSSGVPDVLNDQEIADLVFGAASADEAVRSIGEAAQVCASRDDITCAAMFIDAL